MSSTMGAHHGVERTCMICGLSYRYPPYKTFECQSCGTRQDFDQPVTRGPAAPKLVMDAEAAERSRLKVSEASERIVDDINASNRQRQAIDPKMLVRQLNNLPRDRLVALCNKLVLLEMITRINEGGPYVDLARKLLAEEGIT